VSDSILYLAIVAIWAGFLIPAWVRRPHAAKTGLEPDLSSDTDADEHVRDAEPISEYRDDVHTHPAASPVQATSASLGRGPVSGSGPGPGARPSPVASQSREQMMRARRRMFTILAGLTILTFMFVLAGLVQWWICVPPLAMLVLYVMLLREIAMADAELARKRHAWEARQAAAHTAQAKASAWQRSHQVWEEAEAAAEASEPTAEIIDISARVGDQLYDQYEDAAVRAVGD
jgi:hypothetical protein